MPGAAPRGMETRLACHYEARSLGRSNPSHARGIASGLRPLAMTQQRRFPEQKGGENHEG